MSECPSEERLAEYAAGACGADEASAVERHAERCESCRAWLTRERQVADWFDGVCQDVGTEVLREVPGPDAADSRTAGHPQEAQDAREDPGTGLKIPDCRIIRQLSRGGQGIVYEALQLSTKRKVAVKVLLPGAHASASARKRFEREIELIAKLRHPNIISIHQTGTLPDGGQYYVMDYVRGLPLDRHVREKKLCLEEVLRLFATVCDAVQYAHQRGVIHRDLKPTNTLVDSEGRPQILDFGLAKPLTDRAATLVSVSQEVIGTLPYMSPEQAVGSPDEIDTRTDVYALGVIFYELLTGHYPYPVKGALPDVVRNITETPPTPPSRIWTSDSGVTRRSTRRLRAGECPIDREIQTILLKPLAKERERRYQSAGELARDIRHYLAGEPIEARRDSGLYLLKKMISRYRGISATVAISVLCGIGFGVTATVVYQRKAELAGAEALRQKDIAQAKAAEAGRQREIADAKAAEAAGKEHVGRELSSLLALTAPEEPDLAARVGALKLLYRYVNKVDTSQAKDLATQIIDGRLRGLLNNLEVALATNDLASVAQLFAQDTEAPTLQWILQRGGRDSEGNSFLARFCLRLDRWIQFPAPVGHGQEMRDCLDTLLAFEPNNDRARAVAMAMDSHWSPSKAYEENFDEYDEDRELEDWDSDVAPQPCRIRDGAMLISSTPACSGTARKRGLQLDARVVVLSWTLRLLPDASGQLPRGCANVLLAGPEGKICRGGVMYGHFEFMQRDATTGELVVVRREPARADQLYEMEMRYFRDRSTYDVLVNGDFLVEEAPCDRGGAVTEIWAGPNQGLEMLLDDIVLRCSDRPLKRDLGADVPLIDPRMLPIAVVARLPIPSTGTVGHDFDGDGCDELITGHAGQRGALTVFRVDGTTYEGRLIDDWVVSAEVELGPCSMIGSSVAVWGIGQGAAAVREAERGFVLLQVDEDFSIKEIFRKLYPEQGGGTVVPIQYSDGRRGIVVAMDHPGRAFELFAEGPGDSGARYVSLGYFIPHKPNATRASDIYSVVPYGLRGDTLDTFFIGWGQWAGNCPALVKLVGGRPVPDEEFVVSNADRVSPRAHSVTAQPLTGPTGRTRLALFCPGSGTPHLIAVSSKTKTEDTAESFSTGYGVRVWPIPRLLDGEHPVEPVFFAPMDAQAVATTEMRGRQVFAVASIEPIGLVPGKNVALQIYGLVGDQIELLWKATFFDVPWYPYDLCFADVDGNGDQELLMSIGRGGVILFKVEAN